jgi:beta-galactosidase/beta-glucuronidase
MFLGHRFDVKQAIRSGRNILEIRFGSPMLYIRARRKPGDFHEWNDPVGGCCHIRKEQCSFGWDWGPRFATCGIYKPICLEAWRGNHIEAVRISQRHEAGYVAASIEARLVREGDEVRGVVRRNDQLVAEISNLKFEISNPELWWPNGHGDQPLYDVRLELAQGDKILDRWSGRIGLRTIAFDRHPDEFGERTAGLAGFHVRMCDVSRGRRVPRLCQGRGRTPSKAAGKSRMFGVVVRQQRNRADAGRNSENQAAEKSLRRHFLRHPAGGRRPL